VPAGGFGRGQQRDGGEWLSAVEQPGKAFERGGNRSGMRPAGGYFQRLPQESYCLVGMPEITFDVREQQQHPRDAAMVGDAPKHVEAVLRKGRGSVDVAGGMLDDGDDAAGMSLLMLTADFAEDRKCLAAGVEPKVISQMLGHATVAFTMDVYTEVAEELAEAAAAAIAAFIPRRRRSYNQLICLTRYM
jgi:hypothetical protein